jgi:hypothetical protein
MTKEEFFAELATIDGWEFDGAHSRSVRRLHKDEQGKVTHRDCPITAVANKKVGCHEYLVNQTSSAAQRLGMEPDDMFEITAAADFPDTGCPWGHWKGDVRILVLAACGLEEAA